MVPTMNHVTLDNQSHSVKEFVLALSKNRQGSVVELAGKEVLRVFPATNTPASIDEEWSDSKNQRRASLVDRKIDGTLTPEEANELADLQVQMLRYRDRVAPLPIEYARKLHQELLEKARTRKSADGA